MTTTELRAEPAASQWRHLSALDGLRAAAVIAVLLFHGGYLQGGFLGVDLFFALSGFLITSLLIRDSERGGIRLSEFWGRRFRRLLPAVFVMIAVVALWSWSFGSAADLDGVKRDGPWAVVYLANWHFISEATGYWASFAQPSMFDHLWSLAIEEQFYVVWPLVLFAIWKWSKRPQRLLLFISVVGVLASFAAMLLLYSGGDPTRVYMGTDTRASSLLVGAVAATTLGREMARRIADWLGNRLDLVIASICAGIVWAWFSIDGAGAEALYRGGLLLHSVACAVMVVLLATSQSGRSSKVLGWAPLAWIGTMSYGLYLWHWPIYVILSPDRTNIDGLGLLAIRIAVSLLAAVISFRLVEDPLRRRVTWVRGRQGVYVLVVSVAALLGLLILLPQPEAEIAAFDPSAIEVPVVDAEPDEEAVTSDPSPIASLPEEPSAPDGSIASTTTMPTSLGTIESAIWAGDSVAYDMAPAFVAALKSAGIAADDSAAFPGLRLTGPDDSLRLAPVMPDRIQQLGIDTVVFQISSWDTPASADEYRLALEEFAQVIKDAGARLVIVTPPPTSVDDKNAELDELATIAADIAAQAPDGVILFLDATAVWADPAVLDANGDGAPERKRDLVHVCPAGAAQFAAWLTVELDLRFDGLLPVDPSIWAGDPWVEDARYDDPAGACAPVG
ncbi:MAG: acyltransferase [Ilumatobacteraceae bacterium]|nr:acyltransferase [Ilumatobacteraceae bacterium]